MQKNIIKSENSIIQNNNITIINGENKLIIENKDWDNIESFYEYDNNYYICPKGKYYMHKCYKDNKVKCDEIKHDIINNREWELKCFYHDKYFLVTNFYLNTNIKIKSYNLSKTEWNVGFEIHEGLLDFNWTTKAINNKYYKIFAIGMNGEKIDLFFGDISYDDNKFSTGSISTKNIYQSLTYQHACFIKNRLYFITYNNTTFISGFTTLNEEVTQNNFYSINMTINENSPLNFYDEITINKINFIEESQYVYYNISTNKSETYYGIIDIESNKVIYNTNKKISEFKPFSKSSMLAISGSSAYLICTFKNKDSKECLYKCDNNNPLIDTTNPNSCGNNCSNYILMPENICIESCDENIFTTKDKQCGLCKDIDEKNKYKVVNTSGCIEAKPENSYFVNEKLKLIACKERYIFENGICKKNFTCHEKCKECRDEPIEGNQNCLSCKDDNDVLQEGNCINKCNDGYYEDSNKTCLKCDENCKTCKEGADGENQNCLTCKENTPYLINADGYNKNCVNNCLEYNLTLENNLCVNKNDSQSESNEHPNYMILLFFLLLIVLMTILLLIMLKRRCIKNDQDLMNDINTELNNKIVD